MVVNPGSSLNKQLSMPHMTKTYNNCQPVLINDVFTHLVTMTMIITMTMTIFYSTIDIQTEIIMYNSLENQIINWSGDHY